MRLSHPSWLCGLVRSQSPSARGWRHLARALKYHFGSNLGKVLFHISFYSSSGNYINIYSVCGQQIYSIEELHTEILKYLLFRSLLTLKVTCISILWLQMLDGNLGCHLVLGTELACSSRVRGAMADKDTTTGRRVQHRNLSQTQGFLKQTVHSVTA